MMNAIRLKDSGVRPRIGAAAILVAAGIALCLPIVSLVYAASFSSINSIATPNNPGAAMVADFDGDGFSDVVATIQGGGTGTSGLVWYENECTSAPCSSVTWAAAANLEEDLSAEGGRAQGLAVGDLDGDDDFDVVLSNGNGDDVFSYINDGSGSFTRDDVVTSVTDAVRSIFLADIDDDDFPDVLVHQGGSADDVRYSLNPCTSAPCSITSLTWGSLTGLDGDDGDLNPGNSIEYWSRIMASDVDNDGFLDVVGAAAGASDDLIWWENPCTDAGGNGTPCTGFGNFTQRDIDLALGDDPNTVFTGRVGSDSDTDILVGRHDGTILLFHSDGASPPSFTRRDLVTGLNRVRHLILTDVDTDGDEDLVVATGGSKDDVSWFDNDGGTDSAVTFSETIIDSSIAEANSVWIGDFDQDGLRDILAAGRVGDVVGWYEGTNTPTAVSSHSFTVTERDGANLLAWRSSSELATLGFDVYRSETVDGPYGKVNETLVIARNPGGITGGIYSYRDASVTPGLAYFYRLAEIGIDGRTLNVLGPISSRPESSAVAVARLAESPTGLTGAASPFVRHAVSDDAQVRAHVIPLLVIVWLASSAGAAAVGLFLARWARRLRRRHASAS